MRVGEADEKFWGLSSVVILSASLGAFQSNLGNFSIKVGERNPQKQGLS